VETNILNFIYFTPLEAERPVACHGDECSLVSANTGFNAPCELLTGFTLNYEMQF